MFTNIISTSFFWVQTYICETAYEYSLIGVAQQSFYTSVSFAIKQFDNSCLNTRGIINFLDHFLDTICLGFNRIYFCFFQAASHKYTSCRYGLTCRQVQRSCFHLCWLNGPFCWWILIVPKGRS